MSVDLVLERVEAHRKAGTLGTSDILVGFLWLLQDRSQLDRLVDGLPQAQEIADRTESVLRLNGPSSASVDEIEEWGYSCLEEWVALAVRRCPKGPVLDAFLALGDMAVEVVARDEQSDEASFRLNGSGLGKPAVDADGELSSQQLALIHDQAFELLHAEMAEGAPANWDGVSALMFSALEDEPMFAGWLLSPSASWQFNFAPFFNLWRAGVSLWVSPEMVEAVQGTAIWPDSSEWGTAAVAPAVISDADAIWARSGGPGADEALRLIAARQSTGGRRLELNDFGLPSLPPALVVEGGWTLLQLNENPGLDPARLSELDRLELLTLRSCELDSFDISLPPGLQRLSLWGNRLTTWPAGIAAAASELIRLDMQYNQLTTMPDEIAVLTALTDLNLASNKITVVSPAIGQLSKLANLALRGNRELASLPEEVLDLPADCRVSLGMTALPKSFQKAKTIAQLREVWADAL